MLFYQIGTHKVQLLSCNGALIEMMIKISEALVSNTCSRSLLAEVIWQEVSSHFLHKHCPVAIVAYLASS